MTDVAQLLTLNSQRQNQAQRAIKHMNLCASQAADAYVDGDSMDRVRAFVAETKRWAEFVLEDLVEDDIKAAASTYSGGKARTG